MSAEQDRDAGHAIAVIRQLHWATSYADGPHKGEPCCGCCAWLDGIRKPWPCDTLKQLDLVAVRLARGSQTAPSATESAETGGGA